MRPMALTDQKSNAILRSDNAASVKVKKNRFSFDLSKRIRLTSIESCALQTPSYISTRSKPHRRRSTAKPFTHLSTPSPTTVNVTQTVAPPQTAYGSPSQHAPPINPVSIVNMQSTTCSSFLGFEFTAAFSLFCFLPPNCQLIC